MNQALLVIDAQQELINGNVNEKGVFNKAMLLENINRVIKKALTSDSLVVFVRDKDVAEGKGKGFKIHQDIDIPRTSIVFDKEATNSFHGTSLQIFRTRKPMQVADRL